MVNRGTRDRVLDVLARGGSVSCRDLVSSTGLSRGRVYAAVYRCWKAGLILRTEETIYEHESVFKGRGGKSPHTRPYHLYILRPEGVEEVTVGGRRFVGYSKKALDPRGGGGVSKARRVLGFLEENSDRAFFSRDIANALEEYGVRPHDIMANVRRYEEKGLVYVRGYKTDERQTPFKKGYLITWLDQDLPRERAIEEANGRTEPWTARPRAALRWRGCTGSGI